ncbi:MAG TPA: hypothetical protein VN822_06285 [Candidatus Acidoferrales bacterium]|nr:hypothetical protein [Candidatus Acidoferrales bacterium]
MSSGFNTDVHVGDQVFHVQTEDRGPHHPVIDTAVYQHGRILHRRASNYEPFAGSAEFSAEALSERVANQHRAVIDDLRAGALAADIAAAAEQEIRAAGIQVQLLNPQSWLAGGTVSLDVEIVRRADRQPQAGVQVEAAIEGAAENARHTGTSDDHGRVKIEFPLPPLGKGDLALVIHAKADAAKDEIRFAMRSRHKTPPADAVQGS